MKRLTFVALFICLFCLPLTAWARPQHHNQPSHHQEHERYSVNISANHGGDVSPRGHLFADRGESINIHIRAHRGFVVRSVIIDGRNIGPVHNYKLSHIHRSHNVHVEFAHAHHWDEDHRGHR